MAKKKKKKNYQNNSCSRKSAQRNMNEQILDDLLWCSDCADFDALTFDKKVEREYNSNEIEYLIHEIPAVNYVLEATVNYIFSNGITTGNKDDDVKLNEFLYRKNDETITNYDVLKTAIRKAILYGECGIRWYNNNIYNIERGKYAPLIKKVDGIKKIVGWIAVKDEGAVIDTNIEYHTKADFVKSYYDNGLLILDNSDFVSVKNDNDGVHGKSPFEMDKLRTNLIALTYERLNYDIKYVGPGRLIIRPKDGYFETPDGNELSTSELVNTSMKGKKDRAELAKKEIERVAKTIKYSSPDSVIAVSDRFDKEITRLPRTTNASDFFGWLEKDVRIICQIFGVDPALVGAKETSNYAMEKIIDNGMLNSIIPLREKFAIQFSFMIASHLGVEKVYFDKYKMQQQETTTDKLERYVNMAYKLLVGTKDTEDGDVKRAMQSTALSIQKLVDNSLYDGEKLKNIEEV